MYYFSLNDHGVLKTVSTFYCDYIAVILELSQMNNNTVNVCIEIFQIQHIHTIVTKLSHIYLCITYFVRDSTQKHKYSNIKL